MGKENMKEAFVSVVDEPFVHIRIERSEYLRQKAELWEIYEALVESLLEEDVVEMRVKVATQTQRIGKLLGFDRIVKMLKTIEEEKMKPE